MTIPASNVVDLAQHRKKKGNRYDETDANHDDALFPVFPIYLDPDEIILGYFDQ
jgi:hypothetical protein